MAQYSIERKRRRNKFDSTHSKRERALKKNPRQEDVTSESSKTHEVVKSPSPELNLQDLASTRK